MLETLLTEYSHVKEEHDAITARKETIRNKIAEELHRIKANDATIINTRGETWKCAYSTRTSKRVDHAGLLDLLGQERYNQYVSISESTSLGIRKATKSSKSSAKTTTKPVANDHTSIPMGNIA